MSSVFQQNTSFVPPPECEFHGNLKPLVSKAPELKTPNSSWRASNFVQPEAHETPNAGWRASNFVQPEAHETPNAGWRASNFVQPEGVASESKTPNSSWRDSNFVPQ